MTDQEDEFQEFLASDYGRMVAGLSLIAGSVPAAEDAVQEALARAWDRMKKGEPIRYFKAWVAAVATNFLRSGFRRLVAERRLRQRLAGPPNTWMGDSGIEASEEAIDVANGVTSLPRRQREVVVLRYFADLDVDEIAQALGMQSVAVRGALFRARKTLALHFSAVSEERTDVPRS